MQFKTPIHPESWSQTLPFCSKSLLSFCICTRRSSSINQILYIFDIFTQKHSTYLPPQIPSHKQCQHRNMVEVSFLAITLNTNLLYKRNKENKLKYVCSLTSIGASTPWVIKFFVYHNCTQKVCPMLWSKKDFNRINAFYYIINIVTHNKPSCGSRIFLPIIHKCSFNLSYVQEQKRRYPFSSYN